MRYFMIFMLLVALFGCTTTYNTKINSDNKITIHSRDEIVFIRDPNSPYKSNK